MCFFTCQVHFKNCKGKLLWACSLSQMSIPLKKFDLNFFLWLRIVMKQKQKWWQKQKIQNLKAFIKKTQEFPSYLVRTLPSPCQGPTFNPWPGELKSQKLWGVTKKKNQSSVPLPLGVLDFTQQIRVIVTAYLFCDSVSWGNRISSQRRGCVFCCPWYITWKAFCPFFHDPGWQEWHVDFIPHFLIQITSLRFEDGKLGSKEVKQLFHNMGYWKLSQFPS